MIWFTTLEMSVSCAKVIFINSEKLPDLPMMAEISRNSEIVKICNVSLKVAILIVPLNKQSWQL